MNGNYLKICLDFSYFVQQRKIGASFPNPCFFLCLYLSLCLSLQFLNQWFSGWGGHQNLPEGLKHRLLSPTFRVSDHGSEPKWFWCSLVWGNISTASSASTIKSKIHPFPTKDQHFQLSTIFPNCLGHHPLSFYYSSHWNSPLLFGSLSLVLYSLERKNDGMCFLFR